VVFYITSPPKKEELEYRLEVADKVCKLVWFTTIVFCILGVHYLMLGWVGWCIAFSVFAYYFAAIFIVLYVDVRKTVKLLVNLSRVKLTKSRDVP